MEMEKENNPLKYVCFYCGIEYDNARDVLLCQKRHEVVIKKNNTDSLNSYIKGTLLETGEVSDGRKTFNELYAEKYTLILAVFALLKERENSELWYSHSFSDGSSREGFMLVGVGYGVYEQTTFLVPIEMEKYMAKLANKLDVAPPFIGQNSKEINQRLYDRLVKKFIE